MRFTGKAALFWFLTVGILGFGILAGLDGSGVIAQAAPGPNGFLVRHPAFLEVAGVHEFRPWFFETEKGGPPPSGLYYYDLGGGYGAIYATNHEGKSFDVDATVDVWPDWYGYYYDSDSSRPVSPGKGKLKVKTTTEYFPHYGLSATYPQVRLSAKVKMQQGTQLFMQAFSRPNFYRYYAPFGQYYLATWGRKNVMKGGIIPASFGEKKVRYWARLPFLTNQLLSIDVTWITDRKGTVHFLLPPSLAGATGKIRTSGKGVWSIKADRPARAKMKIAPDGSGRIDLGYGKIEVPAGTVDIVDK